MDCYVFQGDPISASQAGVVYSEGSESEEKPTKKIKNGTKKDDNKSKPAPAVSMLESLSW